LKKKLCKIPHEIKGFDFMKGFLIDISTAAEFLNSGRVVAIPTETVYGLAASIDSESALQAVFTLKGRPTAHPLILHLADKKQLSSFATDIPDYVEILLEAFCPGPLTFILKRAESVPLMVTGGQDTVGIRFPAHPITQALIRAVGSPLAAPSANRFGSISPTRPEHVFAELGEEVPVVDGGVCQLGIESTIIDATHPLHCAILRQGHITQKDLHHALGAHAKVLSSPIEMRQVSGSLKKHYAPTKPTFQFATNEALDTLKQRYPTLKVLRYSGQHANMPSEPNAYSHVLYHELRQADSSSSEAIAIEAPPASQEWLAVADRLSRATVCYDQEHASECF
jgi:L-threonylcarbamoyladenylate synthase